jgi:hypothetical protein
MIWSGHRNENSERLSDQRAAGAADWTSVLINMNADTVDTSLRTLHDGTVGQLNADFETTVEPFKQLVLKLKSKTAGQVDSVSIESLHHQLPGRPVRLPRSPSCRPWRRAPTPCWWSPRR